jgi:glycosyltransferase involved in cell wall biosynthesis
MKVSFVIPTRNQAAFIRRCIDSCLAQALPDSEVWVMDGASTDGTQEILAGYGDRVRWVSEKDGGQSEAVNRGVARSTGEVIAWINSDDYYAHDGVVARAVALFAADPQLQLVHGEGMMVDAAGRALCKYQSLPLPAAKLLLFSDASPLLQPATFFRRSLFLDVGGLDPSLQLTLDYDLWIRMWRRAPRTRYVRENWANATWHADAKSIRRMREQIREIAALKLRHAPSLGLTATDWLRLFYSIGSLHLYGAAVRAGWIRVL